MRGTRHAILGVCSVGVRGLVGDGAINQPAERQRYGPVWRERCGREDYFDRPSDRLAADNDKQRYRALPVPGCATGQLPVGGKCNRLRTLSGGEGHARGQHPLTIPIRLQVAGVAQSVTVEAETPLINRTDASLGNVVEQDQIAELPIAGRNVVELLSLQAGVSYLGDNLNSTRTRAAAR